MNSNLSLFNNYSSSPNGLWVYGHEAIRFFMGNCKPQKFTWPRPCGHVCSVQFTFKPQEGLPAVIDLRQSFMPQKIVQPRVYRCELAFYTRLQCVCWIFDLESMNYCWFLRDLSDTLQLNENKIAALNNERVAQIDFIFLSAVLTKESILFQSRAKFFFCLVTEFIT